MRVVKILGPTLSLLLVCLAGCGGNPAGSATASEDGAAASATGGNRPEAPNAAVLEALADAVSERPEDPAARRGLAAALHQAGRPEEALEQFERVAELAPGERSFLDLGLAYGSSWRLREAEVAYAELLKISPGHPVALHNLGNLARRTGDLEKAVALYEQALAADPRYLLALYHLGRTHERAGRLQDAYLAYEKVLDLEPANPQELAIFDDALYRMAALDAAMGALQRAGLLLTELLHGNPNHRSAHYTLGQVLLRLDRSQEARRELELHLRLLAKQEPTSPMADGE